MSRRTFDTDSMSIGKIEMTINTNELRRLAQAAAPGPWKMRPVGDGRQKFAVADSDFLPILTVTDEGGATFGTVYDDADTKFIAAANPAANPAAISELLDRLEAVEKEVAHIKEVEFHRKMRAVAVGWEKKCARLEQERDELRAKVEAMEQQEPVAWLHETRRDSDVVTDAVKHVWGKAVVGALAAYSIPLYPAPGAQPAPSVPEGWKLVPIEPTEKMINEGTCAATLPGPRYIDSACAKQCWEYMLAAAPEAKP